MVQGSRRKYPLSFAACIDPEATASPRGANAAHCNRLSGLVPEGHLGIARRFQRRVGESNASPVPEGRLKWYQ